MKVNPEEKELLVSILEPDYFSTKDSAKREIIKI